MTTSSLRYVQPARRSVMRHTASKIDFRRLAGEDEESEVEVELPNTETTQAGFNNGRGERQEEEEGELAKDACICCHQVCGA